MYTPPKNSENTLKMQGKGKADTDIGGTKYQLLDDGEDKDRQKIGAYRQDGCEVAHAVSEDCKNHHYG